MGWDKQILKGEIIDRVPNLTVLADPKPKYFFRRPTIVVDILKSFMPPFKKKTSLRPWSSVNYASNFFDQNDEIKP